MLVEYVANCVSFSLHLLQPTTMLFPLRKQGYYLCTLTLKLLRKGGQFFIAIDTSIVAPLDAAVVS